MSHINKLMRDIRDHVDRLEKNIGDVVPARNYRDLIAFLSQCRDIMEQTLPHVPEGEKKQDLQIYLNIIDGFLSSDTMSTPDISWMLNRQHPMHPVAYPDAKDHDPRSLLKYAEKPVAKTFKAKRRK